METFHNRSSKKRRRPFITDPLTEIEQKRSPPPRPGTFYLSDHHLISCTCLSFVTVVAFHFADNNIDIEQYQNISLVDIGHMLLAALGVMCFFLAMYGWSLYLYALCCSPSKPVKKKKDSKKKDSAAKSSTSARATLPTTFMRNKWAKPSVNMMQSGPLSHIAPHRATALGEQVIANEEQLNQFLERTRTPMETNAAQGMSFGRNASFGDPHLSSFHKSFEQPNKSFSHMNHSFAASRSAANTSAFGTPYGASSRPAMYNHNMNLANTGFTGTGFRQPQFQQNQLNFPTQNRTMVGGMKSNQVAIPRAYIENLSANDKKSSSDLYVIGTELLKSLEVKAYMQAWVENVRSWISMEVVKKKAESWRKSDEFVLETVQTLKRAFANQANELAQLERFVTVKEKFDLLWSNRSWSQFTPQMQQKMLARHNLREELKRICPGAPDYVRQRVFDLSQSSFLSDYKWNSGGQWDGKKWSKILPTDARLIMMMFFHYMDDYLSPMNFSKEYVSTEKKVSLTQSVNEFQTRFKIKKNFCIVDAEKEEPFYFLLNNIDAIDEAKWVPQPGSQNVFHTITLFGYLIKKYCRGEINSVSLNTHSCRFLQNFPMKEDKAKEIFI